MKTTALRHLIAYFAFFCAGLFPTAPGSTQTIFTDATGETTGDPGYTARSFMLNDYDNDGDLDLFMPIWNDRNTLLRNDRGRFVDVTLEAGLIDSGFSDIAAWLDYDRDGHLDLYVGNGGGPDMRNILYRNSGDGTFANATEAAGLDIQFSDRTRKPGVIFRLISTIRLISIRVESIVYACISYPYGEK